MLPVSGLRWRTRVFLVSSLVTLAVVLAGWLVFTLCASRLITLMYRCESWSVLNHLIRDRAHTPLEYYFASGRVQFSRLVMLAVCMQRDSDPKHGGISPDSHYLPAALPSREDAAADLPGQRAVSADREAACQIRYRFSQLTLPLTTAFSA